MESTLDTLKLRDMMTEPELPSPMEAVMKQTMDGLHKKEMAVIEDILRHHIDCTIEGELTCEKVKAAGISDEDCMKEGIMEGEFMNTWNTTFYFDEWGDVPNHITFKRPRDAYRDLIDRISGKGTWQRNPWVYVYEFELLK